MASTPSFGDFLSLNRESLHHVINSHMPEFALNVVSPEQTSEWPDIIKRLVDAKTLKVVDVSNGRGPNAVCVVSHRWEQDINIKYSDPAVSWPVYVSEKKLKEISTCALQKGYDYFWIDNICINQSSTEEKSEIIPKMGKIYGSLPCIAFLQNTSCDTLVNCKSLVSELHNVSEIIRQPNLYRCASYEQENLILTVLYTVSRLLEDEWFERIWTLQELMLPKDVLFFVEGGETLEKEKLSNLLSLDTVWMLMKDSNLQVPESVNKFLLSIKQMTISWTGSLSDVLRASVGRKATVKQDYVNGILGIIKSDIRDQCGYIEPSDDSDESAYRRLILSGLKARDATCIFASCGRRHDFTFLPNINSETLGTVRQGLCQSKSAPMVSEYGLEYSDNDKSKCAEITLEFLFSELPFQKSLAGLFYQHNNNNIDKIVSAALGVPICGMIKNCVDAIKQVCESAKNQNIETLTHFFVPQPEIRTYIEHVFRLINMQLLASYTGNLWIASTTNNRLGTQYMFVHLQDVLPNLNGIPLLAVDLGVRYKNVNVGPMLAVTADYPHKKYKCCGIVPTLRDEWLASKFSGTLC